jgi:hypothetical protein
MLNDIKAQFKTRLPAELVDGLLSEYEKLKDNFLLGKYEPSELNAGKFCEVALRVLQHETDPAQYYLPLSSTIPNFVDVVTNFSRLPKTINDTLRLHIPRALIALYNIRNHRGVGHIGGDINPNISDSTLLNTGCDWVMAEFIRLFYVCDITEAENLVKRIVKRKISFVYTIEDRKRVLKVKGFENKILLLLLEKYPETIIDTELFKWTEHTHSTVFKALLVKMHKSDLIDYHKGKCVLTPVGIGSAEEFLLKN